MNGNYFSMIYKNKEKITNFNINPKWYKNRPTGISAVIRCMGDDDKIEACVTSCLDLFDEILIVDTPVHEDKTKDIIEKLNNPKIKYIWYPFHLNKSRLAKEHHDKSKTLIERIKYAMRDIFMNPIEKRGSVHTFAYFTNWCVSKTKYSHAYLWDSDETCISTFNHKGLNLIIQFSDYFKCQGINLSVDGKTPLVGKEQHGPIPRCYRVNRWWFMPGHLMMSEGCSYRMDKNQLRNVYCWIRFPFQQVLCIIHRLKNSDIELMQPMYYHTKLQGRVHKDKGNYEESCWKWGTT